MPLTIGFPIVKPTAVLGAEPYTHELISGMARQLIPQGASLLVRVVASNQELGATLRDWAIDGSVDGVILMDLAPDDPVVRLLHELRLPVVVSGDPDTTRGLATVWSQDDVAMRSAVTAMARAGHVRLGHLTGPTSMAHTVVRSRVFEQCVDEGGLSSAHAEGDYTEQSGYEAATALLSSNRPVTAIIADNDLMAIGALAAATHLGLRVPEDVSIVAWDDSELCRTTSPQLSAMTHDIPGVGELLARMILDSIAGAAPTVARPAAAEYLPRGSTLMSAR